MKCRDCSRTVVAGLLLCEDCLLAFFPLTSARSRVRAVDHRVRRQPRGPLLSGSNDGAVTDPAARALVAP